ncbi:hypothetical protein [Isoalcanivorax indicus]|uniref:hypothetical protein n=1 Tax=Isoalcanivorax indicus TaxID=2202653 RepID=UPI000DBAAC3F|nr:hypothetical protein [Isoalcanivorax indicus]
MQWIPDLLKHLAISKLFATAVFLSAAALLFGGYIIPEHIPRLDGNIRVWAIGALVFSATYLIAWFLSTMWRVVTRATVEFGYRGRDRDLCAFDKVFIELAARQPGQTLNLNVLKYEHGQMTQLEMIQHGKTLVSRGLLIVGEYDDSIFSLTERGKAVGARILAEKRAVEDVDA